jgi:glucose/arabinose dehydrogenase
MNAAQILRLRLLIVILFLFFFVTACHAAGTMRGIHLDRIELPAGFKIRLYATEVPNARSLTMSPSGVIFVGSRQAGKVYAVLDIDQDHVADEVIAIAEGLNMPNGVAFRNGALYVAEVNRILRYDSIEKSLRNPPKPVVVNDSFPKDQHHGWKYIAFGPDDRLYVPVGAPCNVCLEKDQRYASIMRMKPDGSRLEIYAHGIRNTVGFDWHPVTGDLWFTNNGRDWMGDDLPPDTLHHAPVEGLNFGFPYCHGGDVPDPEYGNYRSCKAFTRPAIKLDAHVAPLGMKFYTGKQFPAQYHHKIFIAEHGSWNRSIPIGYRITLISPEKNKPTKYEVFADGWLQGDKAWGRPVDILVMPDGSLLVSDDRAGVIYRIAYGG